MASGRLNNWAVMLVVWSSTFYFPAATSAAPPSLKYVFPPGGQRGTKVIATCTGEFDWPVSIWAPGVEAVTSGEKGKLEIYIPPGLAADRIWIRLYNGEGASAAVPFLIGSDPEVTEQEPNNDLDAAQPTTEPRATINGVLQATGDVDAFTVSLEAGQTLVAAVDANTRLGSPIDAILQVVTTDGFVVAENHDDVGLDPRLAYTATTAGTYIVRLFGFPSAPNSSIVFSGNASCLYRLNLTAGPFITHTIPLAVSQSEMGEVELCGWNLPSQARLPVIEFGRGSMLRDHQEFEPLDATRIPAAARLGLAFDEQFSGAARVRLAPHPVVASIASTAAETPVRLAVPVSVTGRLDQPREQDEYLVPLQKEQRVVIAAESQNLHLPMTPALRLSDPTGKLVAETNDPSKARQVKLTHDAAHDGDYRLQVRDHYLHGGQRYVYSVTARLEEPDFELGARLRHDCRRGGQTD